MRTVGMFELARRRARDRIVLSDEGTVLTTYFFALSDVVGIDGDELEHFVRLVPRPDRLVYVKAPISALVERALSRRDPRRHHTGKGLAQIERRVRRTTDVFELVAASRSLRDRVIEIENGDSDHGRRRELVEGLAAALAHSPELSGSTTAVRPQPRPGGVRPDARS
jgi:thymidylate kinase